MFGSVDVRRSRRKRIFAVAAVPVLIGGMLISNVTAANAGVPGVTAEADCQGIVDFEANSWAVGQEGENGKVGVSYSDDGGKNYTPITDDSGEAIQSGSGVDYKFAPDNGHKFGDAFQVPEESRDGDVKVKVEAMGEWGESETGKTAPSGKSETATVKMPDCAKTDTETTTDDTTPTTEPESSETDKAVADETRSEDAVKGEDKAVADETTATESDTDKESTTPKESTSKDDVVTTKSESKPVATQTEKWAPTKSPETQVVTAEKKVEKPSAPVAAPQPKVPDLTVKAKEKREATAPKAAPVVVENKVEVVNKPVVVNKPSVEVKAEKPQPEKKTETKTVVVAKSTPEPKKVEKSAPDVMVKVVKPGEKHEKKTETKTKVVETTKKVPAEVKAETVCKPGKPGVKAKWRNHSGKDAKMMLNIGSVVVGERDMKAGGSGEVDFDKMINIGSIVKVTAKDKDNKVIAEENVPVDCKDKPAKSDSNLDITGECKAEGLGKGALLKVENKHDKDEAFTVQMDGSDVEGSPFTIKAGESAQKFLPIEADSADLKITSDLGLAHETKVELDCKEKKAETTDKKSDDKPEVLKTKADKPVAKLAETGLEATSLASFASLVTGLGLAMLALRRRPTAYRG